MAMIVFPSDVAPTVQNHPWVLAIRDRLLRDPIKAGRVNVNAVTYLDPDVVLTALNRPGVLPMPRPGDIWEIADDLPEKIVEALLTDARYDPLNPGARGYVGQKARWMALDWFRSTGGRSVSFPPAVIADFMDGRAASQSAEGDAGQRNFGPRFRRALSTAGLPPRLIATLTMTSEGMETAEIATSMGVTPQTIRWYKHKARTKYAREVRRAMDDAAA